MTRWPRKFLSDCKEVHHNCFSLEVEQLYSGTIFGGRNCSQLRLTVNIIIQRLRNYGVYARRINMLGWLSYFCVALRK